MNNAVCLASGDESYVCLHVYVYIYIYEYRYVYMYKFGERDRQKEREREIKFVTPHGSSTCPRKNMSIMISNATSHIPFVFGVEHPQKN